MEFGEPWSADQSALVDIVMMAWTRYEQWPVFQFVSLELAKRGIQDPVAVLNSFPSLGQRSTTTRSYCDVNFDHAYPRPPADSRVSLSISGLARHRAGEDAALAFIAVLRYAAEKYAREPLDATKLVQVEVSSQELSEHPEHWWPDNSLHAAGVLLRSEWPLGVQQMSFKQDETAWTIYVDHDAQRYTNATVESYIGGIARDIEASAQEQARRNPVPAPAPPVDPTNGSKSMTLRINSQRAVAELLRLKQAASEAGVRTSGPTHEQWKAQVRAIMERSLGPEASVLRDFNHVRYHVGIWTGAPDEAEDDRRYFATKVDSAVALIDAAIFELNLDDPPTGADTAPDVPQGAAPSGEVFLVHGHDEESKHHVARIIHRLTNSEPVILDEQASRSRTVIEKFEDHGGAAAFAIVLLTPDDVGGTDAGSLRPRARQNVVFELGYFVGRLGRGRVAALTKGDVELPSDIAGVVYISLDKEDWSHRLGREMRGVSGLNVDLNRL